MGKLVAISVATLVWLGTAHADPFAQRKPSSPVVVTPPVKKRPVVVTPPVKKRPVVVAPPDAPPPVATPPVATPPVAPPVVAPPVDHTLVVMPPVVAPPVDHTAVVHKTEPCDCDVIDRGKSRRRAATWTLAGGVALWGISGGISYYAHKRYDRAVAEMPLPDVYEANRMQKLARIYGTGLFAAGTVTIGVAVYMYLTAPDKVVVERTALVPAVGNDSVGFVVSGGF